MGNIFILPLPTRSSDGVQTGDEVVSRNWQYRGIIRAVLPAGGAYAGEIELQRDDGLGAVRLPVTSVRRIPPKLARMGAA